MSTKRNPAARPPNPNRVAEVLMKFAQPVLDTAPPGVAPEALERALVTASSVWNADVLDQVRATGEHLAEVREKVVSDNPGFLPMVQMLAQRRRRLFAEAAFLMGNVSVTLDDQGAFSITANGRNVEAESDVDHGEG